MRLTIDNYDGAGPVEYSQLLSNTAPLTIERRLNAPTLCEFRLVRPNATFRMPVRDAYVTVQSDAGSTLFTGYVSSEPSLRYLGLANEGPLMKMLVHAESDEFLLDRLGYAPPLRTIGTRYLH